MCSDNPSTNSIRRAHPAEPMPNLEARQKLDAVLALVPERTSRHRNGIDDADYWTFRDAPLELLFRAPVAMLDVDTVEKLFSVLAKHDAWMVYKTGPLDRHSNIIKVFIKR